MSALRDALEAKEAHVVTVRIPVAKQAIVEDRQEALREAKQRRGLAEYQSDAKALERAQGAVEAAQGALDACLFTIHIQGLTDDGDYDALITKNTAAGDDGELDWDAFCLDLLAACVLDSDLTADDWRKELWQPKWTRAERAELFRAVNAANTTTGSGVPNG
jgi:hypothetical protein